MKKNKKKNFPFCPEIKIFNKDDFSDYLEKKPDSYTQSIKLYCDWTKKKKYLIHYRMLKVCVRHGMIVEEIHEIISFKQSKEFENILVLIQKNETELKMILRKISISYFLMLALVRLWKMFAIV